MAVNATTVWRLRPSGNNTNGGGYDPGIASPGTDYSQQNGPQVTFDGVTITATTAGVTNIITISGYTPVAGDVANGLNITGGTNFITGWYFITASGGGTWTLDRNCTTGAGAAMTGRMGGGWADFTNCSTTGPVVAGNTVYVLGSGIPNPSSYTYDYASQNFSPKVATQAAPITYANDPLTPNYKAWPDTTGGMPVIQSWATNGKVFAGPDSSVWAKIYGLWFVSQATSGSAVDACVQTHMYGCVIDQFGYDVGLASGDTNGYYFGCEAFSSVAARGSRTSSALGFTSGGGSYVNIVGCNIHDVVGIGVSLGQSASCIDTIVAKCGGAYGIWIQAVTTFTNSEIKNCTIDGNAGDGIYLNDATVASLYAILNNIISNHTGVGKYGINCSAGTTAANDLQKRFIDYNVFYNNSTNLNNISYGPHDTILTSDPYVGQSTENYTLA